MDFIYPLFAVVGEALATTIDKLNYNKNKISPNQLLFLLFSAMVAGLVISLPFTHRTFPSLTLATCGLVAFMIIVSFGQNFFDYVGLHTKNLSLREPINNFGPLLASFFAYVLFPSERNIKYIVAIVIGTAILYAGNANRKLKLEFDSGTVYLFVGVVCSAALVCIYKVGLETINPFYLLLFRSAGVLILLRLFFKPRLRSLRKNQITLGLSSGLIYILGNLSQLYSIEHLGLNFTIMILLLGPAVIYLGSWLILKEEILFKQIAASAALLAVIVWAVYL